MLSCQVFIGTHTSIFADIISIFWITISSNSNDNSNYIYTAYFNTSSIKVCIDYLFLCSKANYYSVNIDLFRYYGLVDLFY